MAVHRHEAGFGLNHDVVGEPVRRIVVPHKAHVNQVGVGLHELVWTHPQTVPAGTFGIFQKHVGVGQFVVQPGLPLARRQIDLHDLLSFVGCLVVCGRVGEGFALLHPRSGYVATWRLHLEDTCAPFGKKRAGQRTRKDGGCIHDGQPMKHALHAGKVRWSYPGLNAFLYVSMAR